VASSPRRPDPLPDREVLRLSKRYLSRGGIIPTRHFKERMDDRKITMTDVFSAIESGAIAKVPEWNKDFEEYNYFIVGKDNEGEELTIKVAISVEDEILTLITCY